MSAENGAYSGLGWPRSIAIVGAAGLVGSSVASQLALAGIGEDLYLVDVRENVVESHVIDMSDAQAIVGRDLPRVHTGAPETGSVDLVIVAASKPETPGGNRHDFLEANVGLLKLLTPQIERLAGATGLVVLLSNPVDILATWLCANSQIAPERLIGYALNDSARFRAAVARELGVPASRVEGSVLGEHGNGQVLVYSSIRLDGDPVELSPEQIQRVSNDVFGWFQRWSDLNSGRSSGWATGTGMRVLVEHLAAGTPVLATASTSTLPGFPSAFVALEVTTDLGGVRPVLPNVSEAEAQQVLESAQSVLDAANSIAAQTA